ncbi:MAG: PilZ domain-containing protein [Phycisphaerales bacterium JB041]
MVSNRNNGLNDAQNADALIDELAGSTSEAVKKLRNHTRLSVRVKVYVESGSLSERNGVRLQGITGDISSGGTQILLPRPLNIGDVYQIAFDRQEFDLAPVFALCLRGRMVRPDAFEAGLRFLEPVSLPVSDEPDASRSIV